MLRAEVRAAPPWAALAIELRVSRKVMPLRAGSKAALSGQSMLEKSMSGAGVGSGAGAGGAGVGSSKRTAGRKDVGRKPAARVLIIGKVLLGESWQTLLW